MAYNNEPYFEEQDTATLSGFKSTYYSGEEITFDNGSATIQITRPNGTTVSTLVTSGFVSTNYPEGTVVTSNDNGKKVQISFVYNGETYYGSYTLTVAVYNEVETRTLLSVEITPTRTRYNCGETYYASDIDKITATYTYQDDNEETQSEQKVLDSSKFVVNSALSNNTNINGVSLKTEGIKTITISVTINNFVDNDIQYTGGTKSNTYDVSVLGVQFEEAELIVIPDYFSDVNGYTLGVPSGEQQMPQNRYAIVEKNDSSNYTYTSNDVLGFVDLGSKEKGVTGRVFFFSDIENRKTNDIKPIDSNVTITFPCYSDGDADKINKCHFGAIFNNQLFLSGNSKYPNVDWHSQPVPVSSEQNSSDLTYFSDLDYCEYGNDNTKIVGYDTYRDGDLIVFKEDSKFQATLYRRTSTLAQAIDYTGLKIEGQYEDLYPSYEINTNGGEGALSHNSIVNLLGSTLFLSKNGVKILSSKETTYNNARYCYDVSSNINYVLKNTLSENDKMYAFKEKLFLIANNRVFMAFSGVAIDNELEWFPIDLGFVPTNMFEIDDEIYFSNDEGNIYRFNNDEYYYKDRDVVVYETGDLIVNNETGETGDNVSELPYAIKDSNIVYFSEGTRIQLLQANGNYFYNFIVLIDSAKLNNGNVKLEVGSLASEYFENGKSLLLHRGYSYIPITIKKISEDGFSSYNLYQVFDNSNQAISVQVGDQFYFILDESHPTYIGEIAPDEDDHIDISIVDGFGNNINLLGTINGCKILIYKERPVDAYYKTKTFDFGTSVYEKTIWGFVLANDSGLKSEMKVGYLSNRKQNEFNFEVDASQLDFGDFKFDSVQFDNDGLPHVYSKYRVIPRVSFIRFLFKNNSDTNLVLSELSLIYTISRLTRGIK